VVWGFLLRGGAVEDAAPARSGAACGRDLWLELALFVAIVAYLVQLPRGLNFGDEGVLLYEAKRIRDGDVMYRDFFQFVTPLASYAIASAYWLFGTSMATARAAMAVVHGLTGVLLYASARQLGVRRVLALTVPLAYIGVCQPVWPVVSWHWFSTCFTMLVLWLLVAEPPASRRRWPFAEGIAVGLLIATQQQKGAVLAAGVCLLFVVQAMLHWRYGASAWRRAVMRIGWFAAGIAIIAVPLLAAFVAVAGAAPVYDALVRFPLENYRGQLRARWGYIGLNAPKLAVLTVPGLLYYAPWAALPPLLQAAVAVIRKRALRTVERVAAVLIVSGSSLLSIWYYPDLFHIAFIAAPFALCAALGVEWVTEATRTLLGRVGDALAVIVGGAVTAALVMHLADNVAHFRRMYPVAYESAFGRVDLAYRWQAAVADGVRTLLDGAPSRDLFCYRNLSGLYLLTGAHNPTRYQYLHARVSPPAHVQETLDVLARQDIPYAVLTITGRDAIVAAVTRHYRPKPIPSAEIPLYAVFERNPDTEQLEGGALQ
jgi:hypothetical protein